MKRASAAIICMVLVLAFFSTVRAASYTYSTLDYPGAASTEAWGINNSGAIVGWYNEDSGTSWNPHGFFLNGTTWAGLDYPGAMWTFAMGINDNGAIVGTYVDPGGVAFGYSMVGAAYTHIDPYPSATESYVYSINGPGTVVGWFSGFRPDVPEGLQGYYGFSLTGTAWTTLDYPGASETVAHGINDSGMIVGYYVDATGTHGFMATPVPDQVSVAIDIKPWNRSNQINYRDWGLVPVAILGSSAFDAFQATNLDSITFGHTGDEDSMAFCSPWDWDINSDGYADLLCFFRTSRARFQCGDTAGTLKGMTQNGTAFTGQSPVRIIPCRAASR